MAREDWPMKGMRCRCKFATLAGKIWCPRCGKQMKPHEWPDEGKVLSFTHLHAIPEGFTDPYNIALVEIPEGPKVVCWTSGTLKENDEVTITNVMGKYLCSPKAPLSFELQEKEVKA